MSGLVFQGKCLSGRTMGNLKHGDASRPVAGTARNLLPRFYVHFVNIIFDRKILAARRAAQHYCASANPEFDFLSADLALHNTLKCLNS
jgi:hypothetical protein